MGDARLQRQDSKAVEARRCAGKEVGLFRSAGAFGEKLAGVPEHRVAVGAPVDWKIALEHRARWTERLDAGLDVRMPGSREHLGRWRLGLLVEAEAADAHTEA